MNSYTTMVSLKVHSHIFKVKQIIYSFPWIFSLMSKVTQRDPLKVPFQSARLKVIKHNQEPQENPWELPSLLQASCDFVEYFHQIKQLPEILELGKENQEKQKEAQNCDTKFSRVIIRKYGRDVFWQHIKFLNNLGISRTCIFNSSIAFFFFSSLRHLFLSFLNQKKQKSTKITQT